jgi:ABC-type tungstate transport system substrate-binding protein
MSDGSGIPEDRRAEFEAELAKVRLKTGTAETEQRWMTIGAVTAIAGLVVAVIAYIMSTGQSDTRDVISSVVLGLVGVSLAVVGSVVFLRYSLSHFLRFWMLRFIYEQQAED